MPVKMGKEEVLISPLFGHAKHFAFVDKEGIEIIKNPHDGGAEVAQWLIDEGVQAILTHHIGIKPFTILTQAGIACYYVGEGKVHIEEAVEAFKRGDLLQITDENVHLFTKHAHNSRH